MGTKNDNRDRTVNIYIEINELTELMLIPPIDLLDILIIFNRQDRLDYRDMVIECCFSLYIYTFKPHQLLQ